MFGIIDFVKDAGEKLAEAVGIKDANASEDIRAKLNKYDLGIEDLAIDIDDETVTLHGTVDSREEAEKAVLVAGNIKGVSKVESKFTLKQVAQADTAAATAAPTFYTVKSGDTLSKVAKEFYGDANRYNEIFEANKPMLSHPDKIYPGQNLRIPNANTAQAAA